MLKHLDDLSSGIGLFAIGDELWDSSSSSIVKVVDRYYENASSTGFYPHFNEVGLRRALLDAVPGLDNLRHSFLERSSQGYCAVVIEQLGLKSTACGDSDRHKLLFALSLALGYPTPTEPRLGRLLWPVKPRKLPDGHFSTYSEHSHRADLHTDTQYYSQPEEYFLLYAERAASCGGGRSLLCNGREVVACLNQTPAGRKALETLSTYPFPFRIPTTFTQAGTTTAVETTLAPILNRIPAVRFRYDTIQKGFQARPDLDVPEARQALAVLVDALETQVPVVDVALPDDGLLLCNNHVALHGRTRFTDPNRYLIRVRMSARSLLDRMMASQSRQKQSSGSTADVPAHVPIGVER